MTGLRRATLVLCGLVLLIVAGGLVGAAYFAPPRERSGLNALLVTGATPITLLPRHGLDCVTDPAAPAVTTCRVAVGALPLVITAERQSTPYLGFSRCIATYSERSAPCRADFPPYAVVDGAALGLAAADLAAAHPAWSPDRWGEPTWRRAFLGMAALIGLAVAAGALNAPAARPAGRVGVALACGLTAFFCAAPLLGYFLISLGYID